VPPMVIDNPGGWEGERMEVEYCVYINEAFRFPRLHIRADLTAEVCSTRMHATDLSFTMTDRTSSRHRKCFAMRARARAHKTDLCYFLAAWPIHTTRLTPCNSLVCIFIVVFTRSFHVLTPRLGFSLGCLDQRRCTR